MKCVIQRVAAARVVVDGRIVGSIERGLCVLAAVCRADDLRDVEWIAGKIAGLRVFPGPGGAFDLDVKQIAGGVLLVSNFTVAAACAKGRRPSFDPAMPPDLARPVFDSLLKAVESQGVRVATGVFGAHMDVAIENDGPVTFLVDSRESVKPISSTK